MLQSKCAVSCELRAHSTCHQQ